MTRGFREGVSGEFPVFPSPFMALRRPKQERGLLGMGIRILGLGTQIPIPKRPSGDREETIIGATRAAYLRRGFGGSWTQPTRLRRHYVGLIEAAPASPIVVSALFSVLMLSHSGSQVLFSRVVVWAI